MGKTITARLPIPASQEHLHHAHAPGYSQNKGNQALSFAHHTRHFLQAWGNMSETHVHTLLCQKLRGTLSRRFRKTQGNL